MMGDLARAVADCRAALDRAPADAGGVEPDGRDCATDRSAAAWSAWRRALQAAPGQRRSAVPSGQPLSRPRRPACRPARIRARARVSAGSRRAPQQPGPRARGVRRARPRRERATSGCSRRIPQHPDALGNLASSLFEREAYRQSALTYERLFAIRRDVPGLRLGAPAARAPADGQTSPSAEASVPEAARLAPDDLRIQQNLGTVLRAQRHADAEPAWLRVLELRPERARTRCRCSPSAASTDAIGAGSPSCIAAINRAAGNGRRDMRGPGRIRSACSRCRHVGGAPSCARRERWARGIALRVSRSETVGRGRARRAVALSASSHRTFARIRWCTCRSRTGKAIDRDRFETFAYGIRAADPGPIGQRVARAFDHFADVERRARRRDRRADPRRSDRGADRSQRLHAALARADLRAAAGARSDQLSRLSRTRWAPTGTTTRWSIDYSAPDALQLFFTERLLPLPHMSFPSNPRPPAGRAAASTRAECGLPGRRVRVRVLQQRIQDPARRFRGRGCGCCIAVEGSVLWLLDAGTEAGGQPSPRSRRGRRIDPATTHLRSARSPVERHVARIAAADLVVDSFPYGAHTTANDALLAGVPLVTQAGETLVSRIAGASCMRSACRSS